MKKRNKLIALAVTTLFFTACKKEIQSPEQPTDPATDLSEESARHGHGNDDHDSGPGHVYTLSNAVNGNKVIDYRRARNGSLNYDASYPTGGNGTGGGLGNQGAIALGKVGHTDILLAVNPGSNSISSFKVTDHGLYRKSTVYSGGTKPVSVTMHDHLVYVLNAGGNGNITGFLLSESGNLYRIHHSTRPLSSATADAAQVSFVNDGNAVAITEKATNKITTYTVNSWGYPGAMHTLTSANATPFGFAVGKNNIFVSEAAGGGPGASTVSSYRINHNGSISLVEGPVSASQTAACWVVITDDNKYVYATNTGSNNVSSFRVNGGSGHFDVLDGTAANSGMGPIDAALSTNSRFLYVLSAGSHTINAYSVSHNGGLSDVQTVTGLPEGATGLAAE